MIRLQKFSIAALAVFLSLAISQVATAAGVTVGSSSILAGPLDYSDTFTMTPNGGIAGRTGTPVFPVELPGINVEDNHGNPPQVWSNGKWSLNDTVGVAAYCCGFPGDSGAGSDTGGTQTGGAIDYGIEYGLHEDYTVQFDAVQTGDRINITSSSSRDSIASGTGLSVFFRATGAATEVGIFRGGVGEADSGFATGIAAADTWNNYAVRFDVPDDELEIFVNEVSLGVLDLSTFSGGAYSGINNGAVSVGASGGTSGVHWTDNFQVGGVGTPPAPPTDFPDPGDLSSPPAGLISYWDFDEADGPQPNHTLDFAYDRVSTNDGRFEGTATRVPGVALGNGLVGLGSAAFDNSGGTTVNVGPGAGNNFSVTTGITVEALIVPAWTGASLDYDEIFRKEDGGNRILFSFQNDPNNGGANPAVDPGPVLSFGLNVGGYGELDFPLDGVDGRPTLADLQDGLAHHVAATYDSATGEKAIWIDGVNVWSVNLGAGTEIVSGGGANGHIGSVNGVENFNGIIDEVAIWGRALSGSEIASHYALSQQGQNYFVPEPSSYLLMMLGILGLVGWRRRSGR